MNICTIIAKNYVAQARVLAESFQAIDPDGTCSVLVVDDRAGFIDPAEEPFEVLGIDEVGLPDPERMAASYDVVEFSTAVKPWLLRHLLGRPAVESIAYLDPDIRIFASLEEVERRAQRHGVVLTPHFTAPLPRDGHKPSEKDILIAGAYNLGFIALGTGQTADSLLDWWSERLENQSVIDPERGHFADQRWIDLAPGLWPDLYVLRDPGFNLAYWNLPRRGLEYGDGGYRVDGLPLRFFHFSGFDPLRPTELSRHQTRIDVDYAPALSRICSAYAAELLDHGYQEATNWPYGWETMANGVRLDGPARRLHREAVEAGAIDDSIFTQRGATLFLGYLSEVGNVPSQSGAFSRYAKEVWASRPDLRHAFPEVEGRDAPAFANWLDENAGEMLMSASSLPGSPLTPSAAARAGDQERSAPTEAGVNLVGYLSAELGLGEAARQILSALQAGNVATTTIDIPLDPSRMRPALEGLRGEENRFDVNLICVNAAELPELAGAAGRGFFEGRHTAGLWFWEVSHFPERWRGSFDHLDEVWVASEHIAQSVRPLSPVPVQTMRIPIAPTPPDNLSRAELGMPEGFCFLFVFDYFSVFRRKNPLGIVAAFRRAFKPGSGPSLVIKSVSSERFPAAREALVAAVHDRPEIHLIEETIEPEAKNAMIASCDCYVSLHRSEGLGLTMAEAMYFERPVIATAYSGNLDFMTEENSFLVQHSIVGVGADAHPYPAEAEWAEPDLQHASELMKQVFEQPEAAAERGRRAAADIRHTHSPQAACELIEARLSEVRRQRVLARLQAPEAAESEGDAPGAPTNGSLVPLEPRLSVPSGDPASGRAQLHHLLRFGDPPPRRGSGRFRAFAKRVYMRLLRPYASYQQRVNASTAAAIDELGAILRDALEIEAATVRSSEKRETRTREEVVAVDAELAEIRQELRKLSDNVDVTFDRDRAFVDALRSSQERFRVDTAAALGDLSERAAEATELVVAANAKPYMSEDRFAKRSHPLLGDTIGFRTTPGETPIGGYRGFEDLFRGSEEMIRDRQRVYLDLIAGFAPVLDAGCGRGEFLDLLEERGVEFQGVDLDPDMVERCREKGHADVEYGDLLDHLERTPAGSLGTVFSARVIEHLELSQLQRFLELSLSRLRPGGLLIAETVNTHSAAALKAFWVDPTHRQPLFPETMLALCQLAGYAAGDVFSPLGTGDWEDDRTGAGEYAIVAVAPERNI